MSGKTFEFDAIERLTIRNFISSVEDYISLDPKLAMALDWHDKLLDDVEDEDELYTDDFNAFWAKLQS